MSIDNVNQPSHYKTGGIETIDYLKAKLTKDQFDGFLLGNVLKYTSRFQHKNGIEDLKKAEWYLKKLIAENELHEVQPEVNLYSVRTHICTDCNKLLDANQMFAHEYRCYCRDCYIIHKNKTPSQ